MIKFTGVAVLFLLISFSVSAQKIFVDSLYAYDSALDIVYGQNYNYAYNQEDTLRLDLYFPNPPQNFLHPVIVYAHAGGLTSGDKSTDKLGAAFAAYYAERGYLVASINYRLGNIPKIDSDNWANIYCATQDAKSAIRFMRANRLEYCVDTGSVFFLGSSAGGSIALTSAYMEQNEFDPYVDTSKYGQLENASGNPGYSDHLDAIINCWGGLNDTTVLKGEKTPNYLFHGTDDKIVPYYEGIDLNGILLFGSYYIHQASVDYGVESYLKPFIGQGHGIGVNSPQLDTVLLLSTPFLFSHLSKKAGKACVITDINAPEPAGLLEAFYNPVSSQLIIKNNGMDWNGVIELTDLGGRKLLDRNLFLASDDNLALSLRLAPGVYILHGIRNDDSFSQKLLVH